MGLQIPRMLVQIGDLPLGMCWPTPDEYAKLIASKLIVTPPQDFSTFVYGAIAPTSDQGPWFNTTLNEWWVWSQTAGKYISEKPSSITGEVAVGTFLYWEGPIARVREFWGDNWMYADNRAISRTDYPVYFSLVGTKWGAGDGLTTFNIRDGRNNVAVGADQDVAGESQTTIDDGVTPSKSRGYVEHIHHRGVPSSTGFASGFAQEMSGSGWVTATPILDDAGQMTPMRVLMPYAVGTPIVRVK